MEIFRKTIKQQIFIIGEAFFAGMFRGLGY